MPRYQITGADNKPYEIEANDDSEAQRMETFINDRLAAGDTDPANWKPENAIVKMPTRAQRLTQAREKVAGQGGYQDLLQQGVTFGLSDELAGLVTAGMNPLTPGSYEAGRDAERARIEQARANTGGTGTVAEIAGGLLGGVPKAGVSALLTAGQTFRNAATAGAAGGALGGFGSGNGALDSLVKAGVGGGLGALIGTAAPIVANVAANRIGGLSRMFGRDTDGLSRQIVGEAITADASSPAAVGQRLQDAGQRGVPLAIADTGENTRGLLASVSRQPGPARQLAREAVGQRQVEQGDRVVGAISRDLGPVANVRQQSADILSAGRERAAPLYEQAYAIPGRTSGELEALLATPAGRGALNRARTIAANERRDPNRIGFDLDENGETILTSVPSQQTLDYVKRGLDDQVEAAGQRDVMSGNLRLDEAGRAIDGVRRDFLQESDRLNPEYAAARSEAADYLSANEALQLGRTSLTDSAENIEAALGRMGQTEREQFALGLRAAMADNLGSAVDGADKVGRLLGTPRKRAALASVFGGEENFGRFLQTMTDERATNETYRSVMTGSQTAERLAADAQTNDGGLAETAMNVAARGGNTTAIGLFGDALKALREVDRFGAGEAGNRTRESVAALLTETDPAVLAELSRSVNRALARQRGQASRINNVTGRIGSGLGNNTGLAVGSFGGAE